MSYPNSSPTANTFLVDSLIGACRADNFYSSSSMYLPSSADLGSYGMQTCGLLPSLAKRGEINHQNVGMNVHSYIPQLDNWADPTRSCRIEQASNQMPSCTFSQNIKEESNCCMYSDKRAKVSSSEMPAYSNLLSEPCTVDGPEIPVPGYFRLSQTYTTAKNQDYRDHETNTPNTLMQLNRLTPKPHSASFAEAEKKISETEEETRSPSPENTASPQEEKISTADASVSSPELPHKETKGGHNKRI